jgi:hypothetical protein
VVRRWPSSASAHVDSSAHSARHFKKSEHMENIVYLLR